MDNTSTNPYDSVDCDRDRDHDGGNNSDLGKQLRLIRINRISIYYTKILAVFILIFALLNFKSIFSALLFTLIVFMIMNKTENVHYIFGFIQTQIQK